MTRRADLPEIAYFRAAVRPPDRVSVSAWADRHRILPDWAAHPGAWHTDRTPYLREIMDAVADSEVEAVTFCKPTQVGGTEALLNMLGYVIDQDPGPGMLVMPREEDLKYMVKQRIVPMIEASDVLRAQLTERSHDLKAESITFRRMPLYFVTAGSPAGLRSRPVRFLFIDEPDGMPESSGEEGSPIDLAEERTRTYWNRKILKTSTPTVKTGPIWRSLLASDQRRFWVPCPHCGRHQVLNFKGGVRWPAEERDPARIRELRLASYGCAHCGAVIGDDQKPRMLRGGVWVPQGCTVRPDGSLAGTPDRGGRHRGYHMSALYSPWLTWSDVAAKFLEATQSGDREKLCVFVNCWLGEPWEDVVEEIREDRLDRLALPYARDTVPEGALTLTAGVDVQKGFMVYTIRAWGQNESSWLVRAARTDTWDALVREVLEATYGGLQVQLCCVDANYRSDEVYDFCRQWRDVCRPTIGRATIAGLPYTMSKVDRNPEGGELPAHLVTMRFIVNTEFFKDRLSRYMTEEQPRWRVHKEPDPQYLREVTAEHKVLERAGKRGEMRQVWRKRPGHRDNHFWDAEVLALVAAHMVGALDLRLRAIAGPERKPPESEKPPQQARQPRGWGGSRWGSGRWR